MANLAGAGFEQALEQLVRRVVESTVASLRVDNGQAAPAQPVAGTAAGGSVALAAVSRSVADILHPTGQTEIMAAALKACASLGGPAVLFVRRGDSFSLWRAEGLSPQALAALRSVAVPTNQPGAFEEMLDAQAGVCTRRGAGALPPALEQALGETVGAHVCLLPVSVQGKVVAALYSDAGGMGSDAMSALEILAKVAGLSLETAGARAAQPVGSRSAAVEAPRVQSQAPPPAEAVGLETPAPALEESPSRGSFAAGFPVAAVSGELPPPPDVEALPEAERESHRKAHRFARVAVQDLLSYHRDKIEQGRRNKNLFQILREDIEKTRENYQKRFGETPARAFDYLHYEMVAKLAGNDPAMLGDQYPGPQAG